MPGCGALVSPTPARRPTLRFLMPATPPDDTFTPFEQVQVPSLLVIDEHIPESNVSALQLQHASFRPLDTLPPFPIVALGGSAGSLEALEHFFLNMPLDSGVALVVVVHQLPTSELYLADTLRAYTQLPVQTAEDGMIVQPDHVYVIPPGKDMSILHGTLLLFTPVLTRVHWLPIDFFMQSLAKDARDRAVCIILSGLGSDGVIGLKMVVENFGMVMVQAPETAEFDSMPRSAIATEFVDFVLPPEQLPTKLLTYLREPSQNRLARDKDKEEEAARPVQSLQKIFMLIRAHTGHDFSLYKRNTVFRRLERRMNSHQVKELSQYVRYLQETPTEVELLFKELLIGVTKFFRDPDAFAALKARLLPLLRQKPADSTIRVWLPGCSTGEEAYSVAMLLQECLSQEQDHRYLKIQIFATDINVDAIEYARAGSYPENIVADVSPERLSRFFVKTDGAYQIRKEVRDVVVFAVHNINKDAPFTRLDLLGCRNLLIYLSAELQKMLIPVFHYALHPNGLLFLGPSENLMGYQELFSPLDVKWKIYRRTDSSSSLGQVASFPFALTRQQQLPAHSVPAMASISPRKSGPFATHVQKVLLRAFTPPAVVINAKGDILYVNGRTGKYLEPAPGLGALNVFDMARDELNYEISAAVHRVANQQEEVVVEKVKVKTDAGFQLVRLRVRCLEQPEELAGLFLLAFEDVPTPRRLRKDKNAPAGDRNSLQETLESELIYTKQRLQMTIEEMESSLEELKSTNEELQSANEELQSTNEEAMTNKEEMQSLNEELMTLNMQYMSKTKELSEAANDMKNLLDSTEIATIFIDNEMIIKRFTPPVVRIINLLPGDVGRPLAHFTSNLQHTTLVEDVQLVLDRLVNVETNIQTTQGEWFVMRILPYRTLDNYISGAVITFTDITGLKHLEQKLQASTALAESIVETVRESLLVLDAKLRIVAVSEAFEQQFDLKPGEAKGQLLASLQAGAWQQPELFDYLQALVQDENKQFEDAELYFPHPTPRTLRLYGRRVRSLGQSTEHLILSVQTIADASPPA